MHPTQPGIEQVEREHLSRLFGGFARLRSWVLLLPVGIALSLAVLEPAVWRRVLLVSMAAFISTISFGELLRFRRHGLRGVRFGWTLTIAAVVQTVGVAATGALESPVLPSFLPLGLLLALFVPSRPLRRALCAWQLLGLWALLALELRGRVPDLMPRVLGGGARAGHNDVHLVATAAIMTLFLLVVWRGGAYLRETYGELLRGLLEARDDVLRTHAEQAHQLTTHSAEIAHELKNPLASVKGLAALTAKHLDGKDAERIAVLRREVDRMQAILEEFLNFSRPIGPLSEEEVDLGELCASVIALHEGVCRDRDVAVELRAGDASRSRCDPRKVKQILINLLQNALDASPPGGAIAVEVDGDAALARIALLDRGPGLAPSVEARAFEAGVTTRIRGSGLGLTVARALARQHGGELRLLQRDGGGCVAELTLPRQGPHP